MDLRSGHCYWPIKSGLIHSYPPLRSDLVCDVVILGAGITGALIADQFVADNVDVIVLDKRDVASGSTSASTAMLQYEIDTHLYDLIEKMGKEDAERAYWLCCNAIDDIEKLARSLPDDCGFSRKGSFYFASNDDDIESLEREYIARKSAGFNIELWRSSDISKRFGLRSKLGLYSHHGAQIDPFRLAHQLLYRTQQRGAKIFDRTEALEIEQTPDGVIVKSDRGYDIYAKKIIFACGYEAQKWLKQKVVSLKSTFAIVTEPLDHFNGWYEQCLMWESARPYAYLRTTADGRAIIGGEDIDFKNSELRDALIPKKRKLLEQKLAELMPEISFEIAYTWSGTFGETDDGLAYIGETDEYPNAYFALGYGGNGITYSISAAKILSDLYFGKPNKDAKIFSFSRNG